MASDTQKHSTQIHMQKTPSKKYRQKQEFRLLKSNLNQKNL